METTSGTDQHSTATSRLSLADWREIASTAVNDYRAIQHSSELAALLALAAEARPGVVLEIGTFAGGTAWAFAQLPTVRKVITVDRDPQAEAYGMIATLGPKGVLVCGGSTDAKTRQAVIESLDGYTPDLLFIDGSHDFQSVSDDWYTWARMVRPGGMVAFHDVEVHRNRPEVEVHAFWDRIRSTYPSVKITAAPGEWAGIGIIWR